MFMNAKKTQVKQMVINAQTIDMRMKWDSELQEWDCNVKQATSKHYNPDWAYFTNCWRDASDTLVRMAHDAIEVK